MSSILWIIGALVIPIILVVAFVNANSHKCGWCGKTFLGTAYYEAGGNENTILCEDCAKKYYEGVDYSLYTVD